MTDYSKLPANFQGGMQRYIENGIAPGSFLCAVLENNLYGAVHAGTPDSIAALPTIVSWLDREAPCESYGCVGSVIAWRQDRQADSVPDSEATKENVVYVGVCGGRWMETK